MPNASWPNTQGVSCVVSDPQSPTTGRTAASSWSHRVSPTPTPGTDCVLCVHPVMARRPPSINPAGGTNNSDTTEMACPQRESVAQTRKALPVGEGVESLTSVPRRPPPQSDAMLRGFGKGLSSRHALGNAFPAWGKPFRSLEARKYRGAANEGYAFPMSPSFRSIFWPVLSALLIAAAVTLGAGLLMLGVLASKALTPPTPEYSPTPTQSACADDGNPQNDWMCP